MALKHRCVVGAKVRLNARFLRNTGQYTGEEPFKRWTVVECHCSLCSRDHAGSYFVAVNEPYCDETLETCPELKGRWRHINVANLQVIGAPPIASEDCP